MEDLKLDQPNSEKLVLMLKDKKQLRGTPQEPAAISQTRNAFEKVYRAIEFEQERWMEP